ncbi:Rhodanese-related sulfurtransferase [Sinosporangium album]|uniref:Rhodanese-related sulfurtransferase n=1 Tax=Sinosporangium album TaxID=504805 RepID=A0A1G7WR04_9ACTN|nr:rhodanese-like domain-containing protein [Sinosporangium album]SDG74397.1 Rhodanese-related sulfurtransferase [Sinosporangium album]
MSLTTVDVATARTLLAGQAPPAVLDVRTPGEYATGHIPGSVNVPLDQTEGHARRVADALSGPVLIVCQAGARAARAHAALAAEGLAGASVLDGGLNAWSAAGGSTVPAPGAKPRWALERQVRLVAGGLVAGSIAASVRWPRARFAAGAIGAGLVFAAVTNTCAMGAALSKLPYNRGGGIGGGIDLDAALRALRAAHTPA